MGTKGFATFWLLLQLLILSAVSPAHAYHPSWTRKGVLLWQVELSPDQCGSDKWTPCYNVYAVNETHGDLVWFAFTTSSAAVKGMYWGQHSVYYTTWSGPGMYAVNPRNGHVRWQFPLDNWLRPWKRDIDLGHSASFGSLAEAQDTVYASAAGPPARLYGVRTKSGSRQWEYKLPQASAELAGLTGPVMDGGGGRGRSSTTVVMALNSPSSNSSWLQALSTSAGSIVWQSQQLNDTLLGALEVQESFENRHNIVLATTTGSDAILAFNATDGSLLWRRDGGFCPSPSPIVDVYRGQLLLATSCEDLSGLVAVDLDTGKEQWKHWAAPAAAKPLGNCSSYSQIDGSVLFGCSCAVDSKLAWQAGSSDPQPLLAVGDGSGGSGHNEDSSSRQLAAAAGGVDAGWDSADGAHGHGANGICLYSLSSRTGKVRWVLPMVGNASFPEGAQLWGMAPVVYKDSGVFLASDRLVSVDLDSGKLQWVLPLQRPELLQASQLPVVDAGSGVLVLAAQVAGGAKTGLSAVALREGRLLWHKTVNGTVQVGQQASEGPQQPLVTGGRVFVEACKRSRCCLRALNVSSGKQRWGMCLDAVQGDDATHPHAQFAIWFISLLTVVSIALLILGAALVYFQRWTEERRILYGGGGVPTSPRQPLLPRNSDSDEGE